MRYVLPSPLSVVSSPDVLFRPRSPLSSRVSSLERLFSDLHVPQNDYYHD